MKLHFFMSNEFSNILLSSEIDFPSILVGDHLALDFTNTIAAPKGELIEWIGTGADLLEWLLIVEVISPAERVLITSKWSSRDIDEVAREARKMREWFREIIIRIKEHGHGSLMLSDIEKMNDLLSLEKIERYIEPGKNGERIQLEVRRLWNEPRELLFPIVSSMAELLAEGDLDLMRECKNELCTLWFYDRTKGHRRMWCSPSMCGNRAKVAAFRERKRIEQPDS